MRAQWIGGPRDGSVETIPSDTAHIVYQTTPTRVTKTGTEVAILTYEIPVRDRRVWWNERTLVNTEVVE